MVDIVIPTYNNYNELKKCLIALCQQTVKDFEVWIVIDGSSDETLLQLPDFILTLSYKAHILEHQDKKNHGRSATRNLALPYIKQEFIWFLDSDMTPEPDCLQQHLSLCREQKNSISVGAIHYINSRKNIWAKYISTRGHAKKRHKDLIPWNYFITANSLVPADYFKQLNGFDENIRKYGGEDMEFAYRIQLKNKVYFYKNEMAVCTTVQEKTLAQALVQLEEYGREGLPYIYKKHPDMPKVYHLDKLERKTVQQKIYKFLTLAVWSKSARFFVKYLPFCVAQHFINYLVICAIFKGYKSKMDT